MTNDELIAEHTSLVERLRQFRVSPRRLVPELVLHGYAIDVVEQVHAAAVVLGSPVARAAVTNARSAFEAAMDMLLLTSVEADYDHFGALARAAELFEEEALIGRRDAANNLIGVTLEPEAYTPEEVIQHDGDLWENTFPGGKELLTAAWGEVTRSRARQRHWSGLSRKEMAREIEARAGEGAGLAEMLDLTYGIASMHSHGRARLAGRATQMDEEGRLKFVRREGDAEVARAVAYLACKYAAVALERRNAFQLG